MNSDNATCCGSEAHSNRQPKRLCYLLCGRDGSRAHADSHGIHARVKERQGLDTRNNVAAHHVYLRVLRLDVSDLVLAQLGCVWDEHGV